MLLFEDIENIYKSQKDETRLPGDTVLRDRAKEIRVIPGFASIITGIRRCGKSTLMKQMIDPDNPEGYFNFEDTRASDFELRDFSRLEKIIGEKKSSTYFFDEIQTVRDWERYIRTALDRKKKLVITGSNASLLSPELGTKLTGRNLRYELFPFSFREFCRMKKVQPGNESLRNYLELGGFPEFLKLGEMSILRMLFDDIINRDVVVRHKIRNSKILKDIALRLVSDSANLVSLSKLAKDFEIKSKRSVLQYVSFLQDAYVLFIVPKFDYSPRKQLRNPRKVYSIDTGLIRANTIGFTKDFGRLLENAAFINLRRRFSSIYYFKVNRECDFVVAQFNKVLGVFQVCAEVNPENEKREIEGLAEAMDFFNLKKGSIITLNQEDDLRIGSKQVKLLPAWKWLD
jgi:predicted AAA+ superfamily ATPase